MASQIEVYLVRPGTAIYPRAQNFKVLAGEAPDDYIMAFRRICDDEKYRKANDIPEGIVPYYRQLQEWLSS